MADVHPEIPVGTYCYGFKDGKRFVCPHWHKTDAGARCDVLNEEHHTYCPFHLVWDQVKECRFNEDDEFSDALEPGVQSAQSPKGMTPRTVTCPCNRSVDIHVNKPQKEGELCKLEEVFQRMREEK